MIMEKIMITYLAETLRYAFPKKKWFQWTLENRIATMQLKAWQQDKMETDLLLQIYEKCPDIEDLNEQTELLSEQIKENIFAYYIPSAYIMDVYQALFLQYQKRMERQEHIIVWDDSGEILPESLYNLAENRNYFSVLTKCPDKFEDVFQKIERNYGLVPMIFEDEKELARYLKRMPVKEAVCMIAEENGTDGQDNDLSPKTDRLGIRSLLYSLPKGSLFIDLSKKEIYRIQILKKRMPLEYASIPIFLDNIAKNRYNAVVNEGITFQVKNKKKQLLWRRKGT